MDVRMNQGPPLPRVFLRHFFCFSESEMHTDCEVIDLLEGQWRKHRRVWPLKTCQFISYWETGKGEAGMAVAATSAPTGQRA